MRRDTGIKERKTWDTEQHSDDHENWTGGDEVIESEDRTAHINTGYLEARCEVLLIHVGHLCDNIKMTI